MTTQTVLRREVTFKCYQTSLPPSIKLTWLFKKYLLKRSTHNQANTYLSKVDKRNPMGDFELISCLFLMFLLINFNR